MDIILHIGAHRTGTTTFQDYIRRHHDALGQARTGFWGPPRTRKGLFAGLMPGPRATPVRDPRRRAEGRVQLALARAQTGGLAALLVSDENMMGSVRGNLRARSLYPAIGERMARIARAFDGRIARVVICTRAQDLYWSSAIAYGVARGHAFPGPDVLRQIADARRGWRDVITDLACAVPGAEIRVLPFEGFAGRPAALMEQGAGLAAPRDAAPCWLNRAPDAAQLRQVMADRGEPWCSMLPETGRWQPFAPEAAAALREAYADDMMWLTAGADGLATLTEDRADLRAGPTPPHGAQTKGQSDERQERQMAQPG